ncbi:MAG: hypothetical protein ABL907_09895 [Hyphomicrobium sp.]
MARIPPTRSPVSVTVDGKDYRGNFYIEHRSITVLYAGRQKASLLGEHAGDPKSFAQKLLGELVRGPAA